MATKRKIYLHELYGMEIGADTAFCRCGKAALWRCLECIGSSAICACCLRDAHLLLPFHRVEFWGGASWRAAWLRTVDVQVHLGHGGTPCPSLQDVSSSPCGGENVPEGSAPLRDTRPDNTEPLQPVRQLLSLPHRPRVPRVPPPSPPLLRRTRSAPDIRFGGSTGGHPEYTARSKPNRHPPDGHPPDGHPPDKQPPDKQASSRGTGPAEGSGTRAGSLGSGELDGGLNALGSQSRKRTAFEARLDGDDRPRPVHERPPDLTAAWMDEEPEDDEDALEEDEDAEATRFDVQLEDASDMPRVGEEVLEPFPTNCAPKLRYRSTLMMVIVDTSGVHEIPVVFCACPNAPPRDIQLLRMGLYPATWRRPQTAFTFRALDDFLLTNKECKTPAFSYYSRLRRITSESFPHMVPVSVLVSNPPERLDRHRTFTGSLPGSSTSIKTVEKPEGT